MKEDQSFVFQLPLLEVKLPVWRSTPSMVLLDDRHVYRSIPRGYPSARHICMDY
jgi:hypothetical protein